jgi:hypothetical protein
VAAWGAAELYRERFRLRIAALTGPVTDNDVGRDAIWRDLGLPSHNARRDPAGLVAVVRARLPMALRA